MVGYLVYLTISAATYAIFCLGLNLQWGFTGLINFGHVAFMTIGAYATVLLASQGIPLIVALLIGMAIAALLGLIIGLSTLRLREDYLSIVTIGFSELIRLVALNEEWLTRGAFGVQGYPLPLGEFRPNQVGRLSLIFWLTLVAIFAGWQLWRGIRWRWKKQRKQGGSGLDATVWGVIGGGIILSLFINGCVALQNYNYKAGLMLLSVVALALVYAGLEYLVHSPWGRVLKAIREDEEIPRALGKNVFWYKLQSFMLGGAIAGMAGSFYAWQLTNVYPSSFEPLVTFNAWTIVVLGGAGTNPGTLIGSLIFFAYDSVTRFVLPQLDLVDDARLGALRIMVIGLILMVLMVWRPQGLLGNKDELTLGK
ncbi:branched-chain amino acid ABC transporter permease [[Limnothrix rosea] IAM M-220]|uniref:branched-chain amino acid ABC transporter permease n=1 Tax=[Limnothrix rosea] IAM M-220 TaxID=454133 RepID=UPI000966878A|nr:branched-chain amino acid ABC transporter permease [[Limnothrix rosea] IAM M-220]OKH19331.1 branched-chain amino acid ABC transporter permease [[Limnothrix rosea] IAM M-220]